MHSVPKVSFRKMVLPDGDRYASQIKIENVAEPLENYTSLSRFSTEIEAHNIPAPRPSPQSGPLSTSAQNTRYSLHIRQQPRAARAGPDGKDRRAIDPPPILQLMIENFDPNSESDMNELRNSDWVVHCSLFAADEPDQDLSTVSVVNNDGSKEVQRLLLGTCVSSPLFCLDDPDPETMPQHPRRSRTRSASPTSRFIRSSNEVVSQNSPSHSNLPGCFFIFADLSIRKAGDYRLNFRLMKIDSTRMHPGARLPSIYSVVSSVFRGVNAKDFDSVQPSTEIVKGLLNRGAGFPLKLKKGIRESQGRRNYDDESWNDEDEDE